MVTVYRDRVVMRWRDGPTKIEYRDRYLPPEGHVEVTFNFSDLLKGMLIASHGYILDCSKPILDKIV